MKPKPFTRFYFPGLISLILLPLMCIGFFLHKGQLSKWAMMNVTCLDDASIKLLNKYGAKIRISDYEKFPVLVFSNNPVENVNNLKRLVMECKALIQAHAYGKGITVRFEDNATYKDWVDVLDTGYRLDAMGFAPYENKVYFLLPKPVPPQKMPLFLFVVLPIGKCW